jgi:hypothetical protein
LIVRPALSKMRVLRSHLLKAIIPMGKTRVKRVTRFIFRDARGKFTSRANALTTKRVTYTIRVKSKKRSRSDSAKKAALTRKIGRIQKQTQRFKTHNNEHTVYIVPLDADKIETIRQREVLEDKATVVFLRVNLTAKEPTLFEAADWIDRNNVIHTHFTSSVSTRVRLAVLTTGEDLVAEVERVNNRYEISRKQKEYELVFIRKA